MNPKPENIFALSCSPYSHRYRIECEVFYNDPIECSTPCVTPSPSPSPSSSSSSDFVDFLSKFTNFVGLAMDLILCFHCIKNYKDIYPSLLYIAMVTMSAAVYGSIELTEENFTFLGLFLFVFNVILCCCCCKAGCKMREACCKGGGPKLYFTCIGIGM